jgi:hypothetical protein
VEREKPMPEHKVRFDLLRPNEQDVLNRFGVKIEEQQLSFDHQLSESETRWVGSIVLDLFDRTNDEDNNNA